MFCIFLNVLLCSTVCFTVCFTMFVLYLAVATLSRCCSGNLWSSAYEVHLRAAIDCGRLGAFPRGDLPA